MYVITHLLKGKPIYIGSTDNYIEARAIAAPWLNADITRGNDIKDACRKAGV